MNKFLKFVLNTINPCVESALGERFKKMKDKKIKIQFEDEVIDNIKNKIKEEFEKEKVTDWIAREQFEFNQRILLYNKDDKIQFINDFFENNNDLKYLHTKECENVIGEYIDRINDFVNDILTLEGKILVNAINRQGQTILHQIELESNDIKAELNKIKTSLNTEEKMPQKNAKKCIGYGVKKNLCDNTIQEKGIEYCEECLKEEYRDKIINLYKLQKYDVIKDKMFFVAKPNLGIVPIQIIVFPFYSSTLEASDSEIYNILNEINQIPNSRKEYQFTHVVSNIILKFNQRNLFETNNIKIYTEESIISQIMDFSYYLKHTIDEYQKNEIFKHYIDVYDETTDESLEFRVDDFINKEKNDALLILGDYGCGKTSFLLHLAYKLSIEYLNGESSYIPILIPLKDYSKAINFDNLFMNFFSRQCNISNPNIDAFYLLLKYQKFIILFDGFDEVAKRVNYDVKFEIFNEICKFGVHNTKIIITCRPNYFQEKKEYKNLMENVYLHLDSNTNSLNFDETYIKELDEHQISNYIESFKEALNDSGLTPTDIKHFIKETHDLTDLAKRPFLLNIIVKTLPQLINDLKSKNNTSDFKINAARLYDRYVNLWLDRENTKGKTLIRKEDKLLFCKYIAYKMFNDDNYFLHFSQFPDEIKNYFKNLSNFDEIDYFSHDIQSCSFMTTDGLGNFNFIHKSFVEYFVATVICDTLKNRKEINYVFLNEILSIRGISTEIALFINDILNDDKLVQERIFSALEKNMDNVENKVRENIITILTKTKHNIANIIEDGKTYAGNDFSHAVIKNKTIHNVDFSNASFYLSHIENVVFVNCKFEQTYFQKATLKHVAFKKQNLEYADFSYCNITNCNFAYSMLADSQMVQATVIQNNFSGCDMSGIKVMDSLFGKNYFDNAIGVPYDIL